MIQYSEIKRRAEEERFNFEKTRKTEDSDFALDIIAFAEKQGFKVYLADMEESGVVLINEDGLKNIEGEKRAILVNSQDSALRRRFTIAHELAHYFLHLNDEERKMVAYRDVHYQRKTRQEKEADYFASNLLMPEGKVRAAMSALYATVHRMTDQKKITFISNMFLVSSSAASVRLQQLGYIDSWDEGDDF